MRRVEIESEVEKVDLSKKITIEVSLKELAVLHAANNKSYTFMIKDNGVLDDFTDYVRGVLIANEGDVGYSMYLAMNDILEEEGVIDDE